MEEITPSVLKYIYGLGSSPDLPFLNKIQCSQLGSSIIVAIQFNSVQILFKYRSIHHIKQLQILFNNPHPKIWEIIRGRKRGSKSYLGHHRSCRSWAPPDLLAPAAGRLGEGGMGPSCTGDEACFLFAPTTEERVWRKRKAAGGDAGVRGNRQRRSSSATTVGGDAAGVGRGVDVEACSNARRRHLLRVVGEAEWEGEGATRPDRMEKKARRVLVGGGGGQARGRGRTAAAGGRRRAGSGPR
jgi:hypothetical protein